MASTVYVFSRKIEYDRYAKPRLDLTMLWVDYGAVFGFETSFKFSVLFPQMYALLQYELIFRHSFKNTYKDEMDVDQCIYTVENF